MGELNDGAIGFTDTDNALVQATAEVVSTTGQVSVRYEHARIVIFYTFTVTEVDAAASVITAEVRRGATATGTQVGEDKTHNIIASGTQTFTGFVVDTVSAGFIDTYNLTLTAAGGADSVGSAAIFAIVVDG